MEEKTKDGYWWALKKGDPEARIEPVRIQDDMWIALVGKKELCMAEDWELIERIVPPEKMQMHVFDEELRKQAAEMKDDFSVRQALWLEWIDRNADVLEVGRGFMYRIGFDSFRLEKAFGRIQPCYQRMASGDHSIKDSAGELVPFPEWDVGITDTWEKMFPKMFPVMQKVLKDRYLRRDGMWNGKDARYRTDFKIYIQDGK
jgi:hypothetical protein